jgi:hypothetical protein
MPRATINLGDPAGLAAVGGQWKFARGYVPGESNEGLVTQAVGSPARMVDYDDSSWEVAPTWPPGFPTDSPSPGIAST